MEKANQPELHQVDVEAKYFEVSVPAGPGYKGDLPKQLSVKFELDLDREKHDALVADTANLAAKSNKGKHLMIFGDQSGSMSGKPFDVLKAGVVDIARHLFDADGNVEQQPFEQVHMIFYASKIEREVTTDNQKEYLDLINENFQFGGTAFVPCFQHIREVVMDAEPGSQFDIIFLTDGCGEGFNSSYFSAMRNELVKEMQDAKKERGVQTTMYSLGFSKYHDAQLLNFIAQAGSEMGDFIYIDFESHTPYEHLLADAFGSCLGRAMSLGLRLEATNSRLDFDVRQKLNRDYQFGLKAAAEPTDASAGPAKPKIDVATLPEFVDGFQDDVAVEEEEKEEPQPYSGKVELCVNIANDDDHVVEDSWTSIKYTCSCSIDKADLVDQDLKITLQLTKKLQVLAKLKVSEWDDASQEEKLLAMLTLTNSHSFKLIQECQSCDIERRKAIVEEMIAISEGLAPHFESVWKIKDREFRKRCVKTFQGCQSTLSGVIKILRQIESDEKIPNQLLAELNNMAFSAVKQSGLGKMLDKRATKNFELYKKFDEEIKTLQDKFNADHLEAKYRQVADEIGCCPLSLSDALDCVQNGDCLAIGLKVRRPEAAIADPSRVIIDDIFPTYVSTESFLESAKFKLENDGPDAIGGFKPTNVPKPAPQPANDEVPASATEKMTDEQRLAARQAEQAAAAAMAVEQKQQNAFVMLGLGNELITGALPLYLFPEHWAMARRKMGPMLGLMSTLDVMGFSFEQYMTIPYLVLMKAAQKAKDQPSEVNLRMLQQIRETCQHQLAGSNAIKEQVAKQVFNFVRQPDIDAEEEKKESEKKGDEAPQKVKKCYRTQDTTKNVTVLLAQFAILCQIEDFAGKLEDDEVRQVFQSEVARKKLIRDFVFLATEENMRRQINDGSELIQNLLPTLFGDFEFFLTDLVDRRSAECRAATIPTNLEEFYASMMDLGLAIKNKYGYAEEGDAQSTADIVKGKPGSKFKTSIDTVREVEKAVEGNNIGSSYHAQTTLTNANKKFKRFHKSFIAFANNLLEGKPLDADSGSFTDLFNMPGLDEMSTEEEQQLTVLAMLVQNAYHDKNAKRDAAYVNGELIEIDSAEKAIAYLKKVLTTELDRQVKQKMQEVSRDYESREAAIVFRQALQAPDFFYAVAILVKAGLAYGKGDFRRALELLTTENSAMFRDVAKKLIILKNGCLFKKGTISDDASEPVKRMTPDMVNGEEALSIFSDKKSNVAREVDRSVNQKLVFRVWAKQIYNGGEEKKDGSDLTQEQLENIFPEYAHKLRLYAECCDENGRIVRNQAYYAEYKKKLHLPSRRGTKKDPAQREVRKQFADKNAQKK